MSKKSSEKDDCNAVSEKKLNREKGAIKGTLSRIETFTSEKTVSKDTKITELQVKLKKLEQLQTQLNKISEEYCEIKTSEKFETIQQDIEQINERIKKFVPIVQLPIDEISLWTDSTIVLALIKTEPHKLKTFVSNRVAETQTLTEDCHWKHICSKKNPADLISRGCHADELLKNDMWFSGPDLQTDELEDNQFIPDPTYVDELKCAVTLTCNGYNLEFYDELFNRTNNFTKLIRIVSFIFRFINNIKAKECHNKVSKYLTAEELHRSTEFLARVAQLSEFKAEIDALKKGKDIAKTSKLKALDPFLDENALLRVGGRLNNSDLPFESKHQIILPSKHKFSTLLFEHLHKKILHIGARGLVHQIRLQYRPINGKGIARKIVHDCIGCLVLLKKMICLPASGQLQEF
ncbi:hypothetical protein AVEN_256312-1 [Araneus ventricosus]|uniref:Integrase zinc-binding domain-containing protein n=1 Tax=Araneus ventricosus TaxID=182803 RepID=A0A4Y2S5K5_ARAVE|nr:hypothetical protein AVEN_256312-1 [Araneus ventricosus]